MYILITLHIHPSYVLYIVGLAGTELLEAYEKGEIYIDDDDNVVFKDDDGAGEGSGGASSDGDEGSGSEGDWEEVEDSDAEEGEDEEVEIVRKKAKVTKGESEQDDEEGNEVDGGDDWVDMEDDDDGENDDGNDEEEEGNEEEGGSVDEEEDADAQDDDDDNEEEEEEEQEGSIVSAINSTRHKHPRLESKRLLTQADFELLNRLRIAQKERAKDPKYRRKSKLSYSTNDQSSLHSYDTTPTSTSDQDLTNDSGAGELRTHFAIDPDTLASSIRTHKMSKIERISHVLQGRKENKFEPNTHPGITIVYSIYISMYVYYI